MLPSFGSFGKKSGLASMGSSSKRKGFTKEKETRYDDEARQALHSDDDEGDDQRSPVSYTDIASGRNRSHSTLSNSRVSLAGDSYGAPPPMRRTHTTPKRVDAHYVKALYDYNGGAADELMVRAGEIIEVKKKVSDDWWIGECGNRSGLFPSAYCEDYVPTPTIARPTPALPAARTLPPGPGAPRNGTTSTPVARTLPPTSQLATPSSPVDFYAMTSDSEADQDYSDTETQATASLATGGQPPSSQYKPMIPSPAPAPSAFRKPAPPPPPSRRTQSSGNLMTASHSSSFLSPPQPAYARAPNSPEGSPFGGSEGEEDEDEGEIFGGRSRSGTVSASPNGSPPTGTTGLGTGLGNMHLGRSGGNAASVGQCSQCGCGDFTQNVFKAQGICSTCFHQH